MKQEKCQTLSTIEPQTVGSSTNLVRNRLSTEDETLGSTRSPTYLSTGPASRPTIKAWGGLKSVPDENLAASAGKLMLDIQTVIDTFHKSGYEVATMPSLQVASLDANTVLLEWATDNFRVGLSVDTEPNESGWYFVSSKELGQIAASGYISEVASRRLVPWLVSLVLKNA